MLFYRITLFLCLVSSLTSAPQTASNFELIILHNNDMHARFEQTGVYGSECQPNDVTQNKCYGGFARVAHEVRDYRKKETEGGPPVLFLNAGDTYQGTPWYTLYKHNITASFLNILKPDAISLGNHEFDDGVPGLAPFLREIDFPVLATNLDVSKTPELQNLPTLKNSEVFIKNGVKIGVIGYLTPETKQLTPLISVEFTDEIEAINKEAARLKSEGVNILIALGHSGIERDKVIAASCPLIDIVIGGHSHTFLYSGPNPDVENPLGPYPVLVKNSDGKEVLVVQAYAFTKYLGYLKLSFNTKGDLLTHDGTPLLLNGTIPRDSDVLALLDLYRPGVVEMEKEIIGQTKVFLDNTRCRLGECNIGNMIADSIIHSYAWNYTGTYWSDTSIAFIQGGGIRASIEVGENGDISRKDLLQVLPFETPMVKLEVTGATIVKMLERSVERYDARTGYGEFLQMSGLHVIYDLDKQPGERVKYVEFLCTECNVPVYKRMYDYDRYNIILNKFLFDGGDGYGMLAQLQHKVLSQLDIDMTEEYLRKVKPVYPAIEWRITFEGNLGPPLETTTTLPPTTPGGHGVGTRTEISVIIVILVTVFNVFYIIIFV